MLLGAALQQGKLGGAALDVFQTEPLPKDSPLWDMPNVLLSPHSADRTATFQVSSATCILVAGMWLWVCCGTFPVCCYCRTAQRTVASPPSQPQPHRASAARGLFTTVLGTIVYCGAAAAQRHVATLQSCHRACCATVLPEI